MKSIENFINESLSLPQNPTQQEIETWIQTYFDCKNGNLIFKKIGNTYEVSVSGPSCFVMVDPDVTSLNCNGAFEWGEIAGDFYIENNNNLKDLQGAPKKATRVVVSKCRNVESLDGCPEVNLWLEILNLPKLTDTTGAKLYRIADIFLQNCHALKHFTSGPGAQANNVRVTNCRNLETVEFDCISLYVTKCNKVSKVPNIPRGKIIQINNSDALKDLNGCPKGLERVSVSGCKNLTSISGLPNTIIELRLDNCTGLTSLSGISHDLDILHARGCTNITTLNGLPRKIRKCYVNNAGITDLLGAPEECDVFSVSDCSKLTSLNGSPKVVRVCYRAKNCPGKFTEAQIRQKLSAPCKKIEI